MFKLFLPLYLTLILYTSLLVGLEDELANIIIPGSVEEDTLGDYSGAIFMVQNLLAMQPEKEWNSSLKQMSSKNIPISLVKSKIILQEYPELSKQERFSDEIEDIVLAKFPSTEYHIKFGPVETIKSLEVAESILFALTSLLCLLAIFIISLRIQRKISHLEKSVIKFGDGDLTIRVTENENTSIGKLNSYFNIMANKIDNLINENKSITNAVAHDLRSPLARIEFELDHIRKGNNDKLLASSIDSISEDINELESLTSEILTQANYEQSAHYIQLIPLSGNALLQKWYEFYRWPIDMMIELNTSLPNSYININEDAIYRVLNNLAGNAVKYANKHVCISTFSCGEHFNIVFEDDGCGIPSSEYENVFTPFFRVDSSRTKKTGGFGIGLSIVSKIVEKHNASIVVKKSELGGAKFILSFSAYQL